MVVQEGRDFHRETSVNGHFFFFGAFFGDLAFFAGAFAGAVAGAFAGAVAGEGPNGGTVYVVGVVIVPGFGGDTGAGAGLRLGL